MTTTLENTNTLNAAETMITCAYCGHEHPESDMTQLGSHNEYFCPDCIDDMVICADCGAIHHVEEMFSVCDAYGEARNYVCEDCLDANYKLCADCGNYFRRMDMEGVHGFYYCPSCFNENFTECQECGDAICYEDAVWDTSHNAYLCENCAKAQYKFILPYHSSSKPKLNFLHTACELSNPLYFGIELEIDDGGKNDNNARTILEELGIEHAHAEQDGSICNGFELVSQPFTMRYYAQTLSGHYAKAMATAAKLGYRSEDTDTCGLHIHVGRKGLGADQDAQDETITKLWILMYRFSSVFITLSRRDFGQITRWAKLPSFLDVGALSCVDESEWTLPSLKFELKHNGNRQRYKALNLTNLDTIEFRLFKGTLSHATLTATLQLVHNLCAVAMAISGADALTITWQQLQTILCLDSPELKQYMAELL